MKILLTGKDGQVGFALHKKLLSVGEVIAPSRNELDLANSNAIKAFMDKVQPDLIINPAAYTQVDQAETEPQLAYQINTIAPQVLAEKASELDIPIIHFSTDYVFDGLKNEPYVETDRANPQSIYGQTKWEGEEAIRKYKKHIILRTSWVFSSHGQNFLKTILLHIQEKNYLNVVNNQTGAPTSNSILADVTMKIIKYIFDNPKFKDFGIYHVAAEGEANWYQYACFINDEVIRLGACSKIKTSEIKAISNIDSEISFNRPSHSKLCIEKVKKTFMLELPHWKEEVRKVLKELIH